jgi:hypothetical protein
MVGARLMLCGLFAISVCLLASVAESGEGFRTPTATCPYKPSGDKRDHWLQPLVRNDGAAIAVHDAITSVWSDDAALYVQPSWKTSMDQLAPGVKTADGRLKQDVERIRIFLQPDRGSADVYEISVSASGKVREVLWRNGQGDESWRAGATARKTSWDGTSYGLKIRIPFEKFGGPSKPGTIWGFNIAREEVATGEHANWAGVVGDENLPKELGLLRFAGPDEMMTVGTWLLARPLQPGVRLELSYRFDSPEASGVSRMFVSDGGEVFEPLSAQTLRPAAAPSWRTHFWSLPRGMPLRVQFVVEKDNTVYYATGAIPIPQDRADKAAPRLRKIYADLVHRAGGIANEMARAAFLDTVRPLEDRLATIADDLKDTMKNPLRGSVHA